MDFIRDQGINSVAMISGKPPLLEVADVGGWSLLGPYLKYSW